jgi:hypothetical protein
LIKYIKELGLEAEEVGHSKPVEDGHLGTGEKGVRGRGTP